MWAPLREYQLNVPLLFQILWSQLTTRYDGNVLQMEKWLCLLSLCHSVPSSRLAKDEARKTHHFSCWAQATFCKVIPNYSWSYKNFFMANRIPSIKDDCYFQATRWRIAKSSICAKSTIVEQIQLKSINSYGIRDFGDNLSKFANIDLEIHKNRK